MRIKNITLGIPQRVCSHLTIRPIINDIDDTSCNTYVEVFDRVLVPVLNEQGVAVLDAQGVPLVNVNKVVCWSGNVPITATQYALCRNNKILMEDYVIAYLGLERRAV